VSVAAICANCARGTLLPAGNVACGASFEDNPIWAIGYREQIGPALARALAGYDIGPRNFPGSADDMKGSQSGCKIFEERR